MIIVYDSAFLAGGGAPTHTTPSGWTSVGTSTYNNGTLEGRKTFYARVAGASEGAVTLTSSGNAAHVYSRLSYQHPDVLNFVSTVTPLFGLLASTSSPVFPSITTNVDRQLVVYQMGATIAGGITFTPASSGLTERADANSTCVYELQTTAAGAQGTKTISASISDPFFYGVAVFNGATGAFSSASTGGAAGVGASTQGAAINSNSTGAALGSGAATAAAAGSAAGATTVTGVGAATAAGDFDSRGRADVVGVGVAAVVAAGDISARAIVTGTGAATAAGAFSSDGRLDMVGDSGGGTVAAGAGDADGWADVTGIATATAGAAFSSDAQGDALGVGASSVAAVFDSVASLSLIGISEEEPPPAPAPSPERATDVGGGGTGAGWNDRRMPVSVHSDDDELLELAAMVLPFLQQQGRPTWRR